MWRIYDQQKTVLKLIHKVTKQFEIFGLKSMLVFLIKLFLYNKKSVYVVVLKNGKFSVHKDSKVFDLFHNKSHKKRQCPDFRLAAWFPERKSQKGKLYRYVACLTALSHEVHGTCTACTRSSHAGTFECLTSALSTFSRDIITYRQDTYYTRKKHCI